MRGPSIFLIGGDRELQAAVTRSWESEWSDVVQRVDADPDAVRQRLDLARRHLARARHWVAESEPDGALVEAETALVNAADAVLPRDG